MTFVPRSEVAAVLDRHNDHWPSLRDDVPVEEIRDCAAMLREHPRGVAEADDLDTLADRYEREAN